MSFPFNISHVNAETMAEKEAYIKYLIFHALGQASMCWDPIPSGVFDSGEATKIGDGLYKDLIDAITK